MDRNWGDMRTYGKCHGLIVNHARLSLGPFSKIAAGVQGRRELTLLRPSWNRELRFVQAGKSDYSRPPKPKQRHHIYVFTSGYATINSMANTAFYDEGAVNSINPQKPLALR